MQRTLPAEDYINFLRNPPGEVPPATTSLRIHGDCELPDGIVELPEIPTTFVAGLRIGKHSKLKVFNHRVRGLADFSGHQLHTLGPDATFTNLSLIGTAIETIDCGAQFCRVVRCAKFKRFGPNARIDKMEVDTHILPYLAQLKELPRVLYLVPADKQQLPKLNAILACLNHTPHIVVEEVDTVLKYVTLLTQSPEENAAIYEELASLTEPMLDIFKPIDNATHALHLEIRNKLTEVAKAKIRLEAKKWTK